jgi:hypothetical protein
LILGAKLPFAGMKIHFFMAFAGLCPYTTSLMTARPYDQAKKLVAFYKNHHPIL